MITILYILLTNIYSEYNILPVQNIINFHAQGDRNFEREWYMEYKDFVEYIKENAVYIAGEGGKIIINHVIKNNGHERMDL